MLALMGGRQLRRSAAGPLPHDREFGVGAFRNMIRSPGRALSMASCMEV